jgi:hypothetical protein
MECNKLYVVKTAKRDGLTFQCSTLPRFRLPKEKHIDLWPYLLLFISFLVQHIVDGVTNLLGIRLRLETGLSREGGLIWGGEKGSREWIRICAAMDSGLNDLCFGHDMQKGMKRE